MLQVFHGIPKSSAMDVPDSSSSPDVDEDDESNV